MKKEFLLSVLFFLFLRYFVRETTISKRIAKSRYHLYFKNTGTNPCFPQHPSPTKPHFTTHYHCKC